MQMILLADIVVVWIQRPRITKVVGSLLKAVLQHPRNDEKREKGEGGVRTKRVTKGDIPEVKVLVFPSSQGFGQLTKVVNNAQGRHAKR